MALRHIKAVAVFCGSNLGSSGIYADGARRLGVELARADIALVYGGTTKGLMGIPGELRAQCRRHPSMGSITDRLHQRGHSHAGLTRHGDRRHFAHP